MSSAASTAASTRGRLARDGSRVRKQCGTARRTAVSQRPIRGVEKDRPRGPCRRPLAVAVRRPIVTVDHAAGVAADGFAHRCPPRGQAARRRRPGLLVRCISNVVLVTLCRGKEWVRDSMVDPIRPNLSRLDGGALQPRFQIMEPGSARTGGHSDRNAAPRALMSSPATE